MADIKRIPSDIAMESYETLSPEEVNEVMPAFEIFRNEFDEHHDRRERVVKASRDITALSKKIIFSLQRAPSLGEPLSEELFKTIRPFQSQIRGLFETISPELQSINTYRYQRQISPGIQEFIEAISFQQYLETKTLINYQEAQAKIPDGVLLTEEDYLLGLFDMTGEVMRYAVTGIATGKILPNGGVQGRDSHGNRDILADLRALRVGLESLDFKGSGLYRDTEQKMQVMRQSVEKVEGAVYGLVVRGSERPKGWVPDLGGGGEREAVESF